ncbi:kinase-like domain-containing protein [Mycena polygramma]|nr:kinase-like domain-containing protein [Mycena polygramma]
MSEYDTPEFLQQIENQFAITEKDGATFLASKSGYPVDDVSPLTARVTLNTCSQGTRLDSVSLPRSQTRNKQDIHPSPRIIPPHLPHDRANPHFRSHLVPYRSEVDTHDVVVKEPSSKGLFDVDINEDVVCDDPNERFVNDEPEHIRQSRRILHKLPEFCDQLPFSLFISGVTGRGNYPTFAGASMDLYRATYANKTVALKRMRLSNNSVIQDGTHLKFCHELMVWKDLRHPHILPFIGIDHESFPSSLCLVSPWMEQGSILDYLKNHGRANVDKLLYEIAQGLQYLHSQNIVHGDLRGTNILINDDGSACLADFGLSVSTNATKTMDTSEQEGSLLWMAPELLNPEQFERKFARTPASDVYAFGCVCVELYTGQPPFFGLYPSTALLRVVKGERPQRPSSSPAMSDSLWQRVNAYWAQDPTTRPATEAVVQDMTWPPSAVDEANEDSVCDLVLATPESLARPYDDRYPISEDGAESVTSFQSGRRAVDVAHVPNEDLALVPPSLPTVHIRSVEQLVHAEDEADEEEAEEKTEGDVRWSKMSSSSAQSMNEVVLDADMQHTPRAQTNQFSFSLALPDLARLKADLPSLGLQKLRRSKSDPSIIDWLNGVVLDADMQDEFHGPPIGFMGSGDDLPSPSLKELRRSKSEPAAVYLVRVSPSRGSTHTTATDLFFSQAREGP